MVPDQRQHNQGGSIDLLTLSPFFEHQACLCLSMPTLHYVGALRYLLLMPLQRICLFQVPNHLILSKFYWPHHKNDSVLDKNVQLLTPLSKLSAVNATCCPV